jgi:hypothetical protein
MARSYGEALLISIYAEGNNSLGAEMCRLCLKANLRIIHVAKALHVTRMTLHSWFRGKPIRANNRVRVEAFMRAVRGDTERTILPVCSIPDSLAYCLKIRGTKP